MPWEDDDWGDSSRSARTYGDAESTADTLTQTRLKRAVPIWTLLLSGVLAAVVLVPWPFAALALFAGALCGVTNAFLRFRANERMLDTGHVGPFVLSSFLRLGLFGIVAAALASRGPWWSLGPFFIGFFLPLALYAVAAPRAFK